MRSFIAFLILMVVGASLPAADSASPKKSTAKPSAKVEAVAKTLTPPQRDQLLFLLNNGDLASLMAIPGIGEARAKAIQQVRPLADVAHVVNADGVGEGLFAQMVAYAKAGFPLPEKKPAAKKKSSTPKTDAPASK